MTSIGWLASPSERSPGTRRDEYQTNPRRRYRATHAIHELRRDRRVRSFRVLDEPRWKLPNRGTSKSAFGAFVNARGGIGAFFDLLVGCGQFEPLIRR